MSIFQRGILYGCYTIGSTCSRGHIREIVGDFGDGCEYGTRLLDNVGIRMGTVGSDDGVRHFQLSDNQDGKEAK
jgi:hypothetical protein